MSRPFRKSLLAALVAATSAAGGAHAAPAADSAYATDPQQTWVADRTAEPISQVNNIMCYLSSMKPASQVNQGPYAALVDGAKCEGAGSGNQENTGAQYKRVVVDASRAGNDVPMRARIWVPNDGGGNGGPPPGDIFVNLSASAAPSDANPNGEFRLDYCGPAPDGRCQVNGRLEGLTTGLRYIERELTSLDPAASPATLRLFVARSGDTGVGAIARDVPGSASDSVTFRFAYDATYFRRVKDGGEDACFDRRISQGKVSAFRYGLYDAGGARVDRAGGFPVTAQADGQTVQGYAGYFGLSFPSGVAGAIADGATVTRQSFDRGSGAGESYTLSKVAGRLTRYTKQVMPLAGARNVPISVNLWSGLTDATAGALQPGATQNSLRGRNVELSWDAGRAAFVVTGVTDCSQNGCNTVQLPAPVALTPSDVALYAGSGLNGWSQALGGEVAIPGPVFTAGSGNLVVRVADMVYPGSAGAPSQLHCVNGCTTAAGLAALAAGSASDPFEGTQSTFMNAAATVAYTFGADGRLRTAGAAVLWPDTLTADRAGNFAQGVRSGKMLPEAAALQCQQDPTHYCANAADEADVYYVWETGPNPWNQFAGLRDAGGGFVHFDAPLPVTYQVPDRGEFGQYAGTTLRLQYNGFGDLFGIPASCVSTVTNAPVACGPGSDIRWVPAFTIPDTLSEGVVVDAGGTPFYVKWLNREVRFSQVASSNCASLTPGSTASLPDTGGLSNPAQPSDPLYIGARPAVTDAPRVVDGVVKY